MRRAKVSRYDRATGRGDGLADRFMTLDRKKGAGGQGPDGRGTGCSVHSVRSQMEKLARDRLDTPYRLALGIGEAGPEGIDGGKGHGRVASQCGRVESSGQGRSYSGYWIVLRDFTGIQT